ncbi:MAG: hypothetical protein PHY64_08655, partial [Eubacteriales bacterium]|nr:hypothetical protein [Eubacteriales bacterium]
AGNGRYVVAIGFMGTGSRFYDWFSNFRFTTEEGFHKGFHQLTQVFEQSVPRIQFPAAAAALGRPSLTLADILAEMRSPRSRFTLWMAGHSQGGAVMQIFCHRLMSAWGVPPRNIIGYGFASPTTAVGGIGRDPADYPLFHILNSDDLVPRIGALVHLGLALEYPADDALRAAAYGWGDEPEEIDLRGKAEDLCSHISDMPTLLESLAAFCEAVIEEKTEESLNALMEKRWSIPALDKAFSYAGGKAKDQLRRFVRYDKVAYRTLMARRMDDRVVASLLEEMRPTVAAVPVRKLMAAFRDRLHPPHMLCRPQHKLGAYGYIVRRGSAALRPFVWVGDAYGKPCRVFAGNSQPPRKTARCVKNAPYRPARPSARTRGVGSNLSAHRRLR